MKIFLYVYIGMVILGIVCRFIFLASGNYPRVREPVKPYEEVFGILSGAAFLTWAIYLLNELNR